MRKISKTTHYWLFKPLYDEGHESELTAKYMYVRIQTEGEIRYSWSIGYENSFGGVSLISCDLMTGMDIQLEEEFQKEIGLV